jgi:hypothetical protein
MAFFVVYPENGSSSFPETLVLIYQTTRRHISDDQNLSTHCYKNEGPLLGFKNIPNGEDLGA